MAPSFRITSTAPVCPISRDQALPGMPGAYRVPIPRALDMPSAIAAANALLQALAPGAGLSAPNSSGIGAGYSIRPGQDGPNQDGGSGGIKKKSRRWVEKDRRKCKIKYYAADDKGENDKENWVVMERITYLKWHDNVQQIDFEFDWPYNRQDPHEENSEFMSGDKGRLSAGAEGNN